MRAFIIATDTRIEPFGDPLGEISVGGVPFSEWQERLLKRFGLAPVRVSSSSEIPSDEDRIVTYDNVFFTRRVLKSFLKNWRSVGRKASRVALPKDSAFIGMFSDLQELDIDGPHALFDLWALPAGAPNDLPADATPLPVIFKEKLVTLHMPKTITGIERWEHPVTTSICMHVRHWLHVLQANLLSIQIKWVDFVVARPLWAAYVLARGLAPGRGSYHWRVAQHANRIGKNVDIHPTARVEASFIGDGVHIGAQALVRASIIGPNSTLQERVNVTFSVVGERSFVSKHSVVYACASFEQAELCMKGMQMCMVGRRAALTARASPIDVSPGRKIRVKDGDTFPPIDLPLLGSCYGHDTFIGADVFIGPGRAIPNGVRIVPQPARVLTTIPDDLEPGRMYTVSNGTLEQPE